MGAPRLPCAAGARARLAARTQPEAARPRRGLAAGKGRPRGGLRACDPCSPAPGAVPGDVEGRALLAAFLPPEGRVPPGRPGAGGAAPAGGPGGVAALPPVLPPPGAPGPAFCQQPAAPGAGAWPREAGRTPWAGGPTSSGRGCSLLRAPFPGAAAWTLALPRGDGDPAGSRRVCVDALLAPEGGLGLLSPHLRAFARQAAPPGGPAFLLNCAGGGGPFLLSCAGLALQGPTGRSPVWSRVLGGWVLGNGLCSPGPWLLPPSRSRRR